ncbi:MAG: hypothetical protein ACRDFQ_09940 [Anaerolineales bacterium]
MKKLNLSDKLATHQYQFDGSHKNRNECALCSMAMLLGLAARQSELSDFELRSVDLGRFLDRIPFRYPRLPAWLPGPGGATHPFAAYWGLKDYMRNTKAGNLRVGWKVFMKSRATTNDLEESVTAGIPTLIYGVGETGIPHVVVVIGREDKKWQILDPGYSKEKNPRNWPDDQMNKWWVNYSFIYPRGIMITLVPTAPGATSPKPNGAN